MKFIFEDNAQVFQFHISNHRLHAYYPLAQQVIIHKLSKAFSIIAYCPMK